MRIIEINTKAKVYSVYIERGILKYCGKLIKDVYTGKRIGIVTDSNVNRLYGEKLLSSLRQEGFEAFIAEVEPGEKSKSLQSLESLCSVLLKGGITRGDLLIAFGGGVVGDLGGYAASVLLRGIRYIQIPTTLIAQVDSSIGGKVGIDLKEGKNLMGSFYQPEAVITDPELLATLDGRYLTDGMGEVVKYACIKDKDLFRLLQAESKDLYSEAFDDIIERCCKIKAALVQTDEKDTGERMLLNFGHTFGHALEKYYDYLKYSHGEAVAIGMLHVTAKAEAMGLTTKGTKDRITELLKLHGLPFELPNVDKTRTRDIVLIDKKGTGDELKIILLKNIGEAYIHSIKRDEIDKWL